MGTEMNKKDKFSIYAGAIAATLILTPETTRAEIEQEKCFGIVKAGKNDCAAADGSHSCASYSKLDASPYEWMLLPKGTCKNIVGALSEAPEKKQEDEDN